MTAPRHRGPGRPRHPAATRRVLLTVRVSPVLLREWRAAAAAAGMTFGAWLELRVSGPGPK